VFKLRFVSLLLNEHDEDEDDDDDDDDDDGDKTDKHYYRRARCHNLLTKVTVSSILQYVCCVRILLLICV